MYIYIYSIYTHTTVCIYLALQCCLATDPPCEVMSSTCMFSGLYHREIALGVILHVKLCPHRVCFPACIIERLPAAALRAVCMHRSLLGSFRGTKSANPGRWLCSSQQLSQRGPLCTRLVSTVFDSNTIQLSI